MIRARIEQARSLAGMSLRQAAEAAGISHTYVSQIEKGNRNPDSSVLAALARVYGVKVEFFFRPQQVEISRVQFRKRSTLPDRVKRSIVGCVREKAERFFETVALFPDHPIPRFDRVLPSLKKVTTLSEIESVATSIRKQWKLGSAPIPDLIRLLEEHGILVCTINAESNGKFDGVTLLADGNPVIAVGSTWFGDRQRFTMAHELGHLIIGDLLATDIEIETAANRFAGAFLVPEDVVRRELGEHRKTLSLRELYSLKRLFGLSMQGWIFRAADVGIISEVEKVRLFSFLNGRGWKKNEPGNPLPPEAPSLLRSLVFRAISEGLIGNAKAAELLGLAQSEFIQVTGLSDEHDSHR